MTQKEKAKAYDEAFEKARELLSRCIDNRDRRTKIYRVEDIESIFPELKKSKSKDEEIRKDIIKNLERYIKCVKDGYDAPSAKDFVVNEIEKQIAWLEKTVPIEEEDERIRKAIISGMKSLQEKGMYTEFAHIPMGDVFAWLEKQGKKTNPYSGVSFEYNGNIWGMCARDNGVDILLDKQLFKHLEKQDIQKEINLVEILKHYPKETELYSPLYGKLWLAEVDEKNEIITCYKHPLDEGCTRAILEQEDVVSFFPDGTAGLPDFTVSKDCMLFLYDIEKQGGLKTIWHGKYEEPCEDRQVLICLLGNYYVDFYHKEDKRFYMFGLPKHYLHEIEKWAYIDDLCEKQDEQKPIISNDAIREGIAHFGITQYQIDNWLKKYVDIEKQDEQETLCDKCRKEHPSHFCQDITALGRCAVEHEQKPSDKVEPKFNVGDFVVDNCGYVWKIEGILNQFYMLEGVEGGESRPTIEWVNKTFHLWTIKDAKAGDVLAINWHEGDNSWEKIIIFKKYHNKGVKGLCNMPCVEGYGNTFKNGKLAINEEVPYYSKTWTYNLHPATIKQCDTLFVKMKESGYEWDAEKKEPKKIEQMHNECNDEEELSCFESALFTAFSYAWQSYLLGEEVNVKQWVKEQSKELLDAAKEDLKEHNLAWNEEDIRNIENIDSVLYYDKDLPVETCIRLRNWLKSIKDRVGCEANIL